MSHGAERSAHVLVPWECACGKVARVNLTVLGPLGTVRCTCGRSSRPVTLCTYCGDTDHPGPC